MNEIKLCNIKQGDLLKVVKPLRLAFEHESPTYDDIILVIEHNFFRSGWNNLYPDGTMTAIFKDKIIFYKWSQYDMAYDDICFNKI